MFVTGLGDLPVFPCNAAKKPLTPHGFHDARVIEPSKHWPLIGVPAGKVSGLDCLDVDNLDWLNEFADQLPPTRAHTTRRGRHLLFKHAEGLRKSEGRIAVDVDVRADGGYFIWWPRESFPFEVHPIAEWPNWLLKLAMQPSPPPTGTLDAPLVRGGVGLGRLNPIAC